MRNNGPAVAVLAATLCLVCSSSPLRADYKDEIGYSRLVAELGAKMPCGAGITVSQVEAGDKDGNFLPDIDGDSFTGREFNLCSGGSAVSSHATAVAQNFYGASSQASGVKDIELWQAMNWLGAGALKTGTKACPAKATAQVQNHSWVFTSYFNRIDATRRMDYMIQRDNVLEVFALYNGRHTGQVDLFCQSYNGIAVGRSDGQHSVGLSTFEQPGRVVTQIVAPASATSYASPMVASSAALLLQAAKGNPAWSQAQQSVAMKVILLTGANKAVLPGWSHTPSRPLDPQYGAGQLDVWSSYQILAAGQQRPGANSLVDLQGWDYRCSDGSKLYFFDVPAGRTLQEFSALVSWNRLITQDPSSDWKPGVDLANIDLKLYKAEGFALDELVDSSVSAIDNIELIYRKSLTAGRYALQVVSDTPGAMYGLAWTGNLSAQAVPEPLLSVVLSAGFAALMRRRNSRR